MNGYYCKHCASPSNTPNNSDHESDHPLSQLTSKPNEETTEISTSKTDEASESIPSMNLLPNKELYDKRGMIILRDPQEATISPDEVTNIELTSTSTIINALIWLQTIVFFKEKKRNILLAILSVVMIGLVILLQMVSRSIYKRCDDG